MLTRFKSAAQRGFNRYIEAQMNRAERTVRRHNHENRFANADWTGKDA